jgi:lipopolysaccharide export system protein LptC
MTVAPLRRPTGRLSAAAGHARPAPSARKIVSRRRTVLWAKRVMPLIALLLLASIALWPQISEMFDRTRFTYHRGGLSADLQAGRLVNVRYRGVDSHNRPYTVTADTAEQIGPERINMTDPKGDVVSENGAWTYGESEQGVYRQHAGLLDLSGNVKLYRDSGVTMTTQSASMDLKQGVAAGSEATHAEGPFGTLDSQGFALVDKGAVIQFDGKSRLILNEQHH